MCVFIFPTFAWKIYHPKKNSERYYRKCAFVFTWSTRHSCQILMKTVSMSTVTQISIFVKIRLVGAELYHEDVQTDMTKLSRFVILRKCLKWTEHSLISLQKFIICLTLFGVLRFIESIRRPSFKCPWVPIKLQTVFRSLFLWRELAAFICNAKPMYITSTVSLIMYAIWSSVRLSARHLSPWTRSVTAPPVQSWNTTQFYFICVPVCRVLYIN
jgi:hypothetical protein